MTQDGWIALATLVAAAVLFLTRKLPIGLTALLIPVVLFVTGVLDDADTVLKGFSSPAVIAIGSIFVVGAGLEESGVASLLARGVRKAGGRSETRIVLLVCLATALLSGFMSNAATVAVLIPAVVAISRQGGIPTTRMLMPLGFSAVLGGNLTLLGTAPNLLVSGYLHERTGNDFGVFDFALVGAPIVIAGILFMAFAGRRLLSDREARRPQDEARLPENLARRYGLSRTLFPMRVTPQSPLVDRTLGEIKVGQRYGLAVVIVIRPGNIGSRYLQPESDLRIHAGDHLYLEGEDEAAWLLAEEEELQIGLAGQHNVEKLLRHGTTFAQITPALHSPALGKSVRELEFRRLHGLNVVSLWRRGESVNEGLASTPLELGDFLLISGPPLMIRKFARGSADFVVMADQAVAADVSRSPLAILFLLTTVLPPVFGWAPLAISALGSALLMVVTRCVSIAGAQRSIDWQVLMLIVGTMPLGAALEKTGVAGIAANGLVSFTEGFGDPALLAILFLSAAFVGVTSSNAAAAVILAPVALRVADSSGLAAHTALLAVAYGCSCVFIAPFAQCNLMVMGLGDYKGKDFLVVGGLLSIVVTVVAVAGLALL